MAHCNYDTYHSCSASVREKTNKFFGKLQDLNTRLDQQTLPANLVQAVKPNNDDDSSISSSIGTAASGKLSTKTDRNTLLDATSMANVSLSKNDPFLIEVASIMEDVELLVGKYVHEMMMTVLWYMGGVEITSYLGHIFSTRLNFQTSMWQLILTEPSTFPPY